MSDPRQSPLNWPSHIKEWHEPGRPNISYLSYEQLLESPMQTLTDALLTFLPEVDENRLIQAINRYTFLNMSGRQPGEEDRADMVRRKGVAGDWKNHFTPEAAEVFDHYAGDVLIDLGYVSDRNWTTNISIA
jgi:hypothetical protein